MFQINRKARLYAGAATMAVVASWAGAADAQCVTDASTVTCSGTVTSGAINTAISGATPPSVTVRLDAGTTVTRTAATIIPNNPPFVGAIDIGNGGTLGTTAATVGVNYFGTADAATNTFTFTNSGLVTGGVLVSGVGGAINVTNTNEIAGGLQLFGSGPITVSSSGPIYVAGGSAATTALQINSSRSVTATTGTVGTDAQTTTTVTGGPVNVTVTAPVAIPAVGAGSATPQGISVGSQGAGGSAILALDAAAGAVSVFASGTNSSSIPGGDNTTTAAGVTTTRTASSFTGVGGTAAATLGGSARVASLSVTGHSGASASIAGAVGSSTAAGTTAVGSNVSNSANSSETVTNATGTTTTTTSTTTPAGGAVSLDVAATGALFGSANVTSNGGAATATIAGTVGAGTGTTVTTQGNVNAISTGASFAQTSVSTNLLTGDFNSTQATTRTATGRTGTATVAATGAVFGSVSATGDAGATLDNSGRIRDAAQATSNRSLTTSQTSANSGVTTTDSAGTVTFVNQSSNGSVTQAVGGAAALVNRATGVIEDATNVSGLASATFTNSGAMFGNVSVTSQGSRSESASAFTGTTVTPATAGSATARSESASTSSFTSAPVGGTATGNYGGTIGAAPGSPLATATAINQVGQAGSVATFSGVAYADATLTAGASRSENTSASTSATVTQPFTAPATPAVEFTSSTTDRSATIVVGGNNAVTVTGALRNNGFGTGDLSALATGGTVTVAIDGGTVEGGLSATSAGTSVSSGNDSVSRSTRAATTAGPAAPVIAQSSTNTSFNEQRSAGSTASVALTGTARVLGSVQVNGVGTGAGSTGATANIASGATIGGSLTVNASASNDFRSDSSDVSTRTGTTTVTRTSSSAYTEVRPTNAGNAAATIAGNVGGTSVYASHGNAAATLSGRVTSGGIAISTGTSINASTSEATFGGTSATTLAASTQTGFASTSRSTAAGGTAALTIASAGTTASTNASAVEGVVSVSGTAGAALTVAQGSRILASTGSIGVSSSGTNSVGSQTNTYNALGAQTGQSTTTTNTQVGGPASFGNAGIVGTAGSSRTASVYSIGGASVTNSGTYYGALTANALGANTRVTDVRTNINDAVLAQTVNTTTRTLVGGAAAITNSAVVTGRATLIGATGTLANTGVLRGGVTLGAADFAGTTTVTSSATASNTVQTAAATRFQQTYAVNQNALLTGGVFVSDPTIADGSSGATATTPRLRATDIRATVNLNTGSVTLGNITAAIDPVTRERLTDTTLNLVGSGFLGVGYNPEAFAVGSNGDRTPRYVNTPNYAAFLAIDPSLGTVDARGDFASGVIPFTSGSTVTGVNLVEKSGAGVFTLVGNSFQSATTSTPLPTYTMDVGTLRVSGGELQLGVNGVDAFTGKATFGIRGNVAVNGGTLLLGRRVTDGVTSVVEGINLRVDGNFTQATGSTISVAATPALVRQTPVTVGPNSGAQGVFGFADYGAYLAPFVAFDPLDVNQLRSTPSTLTVNGNVSLAGTVSIAAQPGAIYTAGRSMDLFTVSGTYSGAGLSLASPIVSPFVRFVLTPRTVGTQTIVSVDVARTSYTTATSTTNAAAAAAALDAAVPSVVSQIRAIPNPNTVTNVEAYGQVQDLATVISALDTQVSLADATTLFTQVSSGSVYGSLAAINVTSAFGEAIDAPLGQDAGVGLWFRPTGQFGRFDGDSGTGAGALRADVYGGSFGVGVSSGNGGTFGIGGGYARTDARDRGFPSRASADTYMVGVFARQQFWGLDLAAQGVFGWSNWDVTRNMPLLSRKATATFDSKEFRLSARVGYDYALTGITLTPFARIDLRAYDFQGFEEEDAGGLGLAVAGRKKTVVSPELGLRISGDVGGVRPFAEGSYVFQGDVGSGRTVSYLGDRANSFSLRGVDPEGFGRIGAGVTADLFGAGFFVRGNYLTGGGNNAGEVQGGISLRF